MCNRQVSDLVEAILKSAILKMNLRITLVWEAVYYVIVFWF